MRGGCALGKPKWRVWAPEDGETEADAEEVSALDAEDAAERFIERRYEPDDYDRLASAGVLVHVVGADKVLTHVRVCAEAVVEFNGEVVTGGGTG